jgi:hypothetical protein
MDAARKGRTGRTSTITTSLGACAVAGTKDDDKVGVEIWNVDGRD